MGRAPCCDKANVKRGPWAPEEDSTLKAYLHVHGTGGNWILLPQKAGLKRCGKSCRLRWLNYLRPNIKRGCFTEEEDNIICTLYGQIGSRWSLIASQLDGRTDNDVKNYWNTKLKKKKPEVNSTINKTHQIKSQLDLTIPPLKFETNNFEDYYNQSDLIINNNNNNIDNHHAIIGNYGETNDFRFSVSEHDYFTGLNTTHLSEFGLKSYNSSSSQEQSSMSDSNSIMENKSCVSLMSGGGDGILMDFGFEFSNNYEDGGKMISSTCNYSNLDDLFYADVKP